MISPDIIPIKNTMFATFGSFKGLVFILGGVELALFLLGFVVELIQRKWQEQADTRLSIKQMNVLRTYARRHNLTLVGDYAPKIAGQKTAKEQEYNAMIATANKYGVQIKSPAGELLTKTEPHLISKNK